MARRGVSGCPRPFPRGPAPGRPSGRTRGSGREHPNSCPTAHLALPTRLSPGPQAVRVPRRAVAPHGSRKLRAFLAVCAAARSKAKQRSHSAQGLGAAPSETSASPGRGAPQGRGHGTVRATGLGFDQWRHQRPRARRSFQPRGMPTALPRFPRKRSPVLLPESSPVRPFSPPLSLSPRADRMGSVAPHSWLACAGAKATSLPLPAATVGREVSLWLASRAGELSTTWPSNGKAPRTVCALPPCGPSAAEFLGRWEAAGHYGCFLRMCKEAFTGLLGEGSLGLGGGEAGILLE